MIAYRIDVPRTQDPEAFATFMRDVYFPAVNKGASRVGQVVELILEQREDKKDTPTREYFLIVGWNGLPMGNMSLNDDGEAARQFEAFGAEISHVGTYSWVATWRKDP